MELVHSFFVSPLQNFLISKAYTFHLELVTWSALFVFALRFSTFSLSYLSLLPSFSPTSAAYDNFPPLSM
jgi:hypothetical protein